MSRCDPLPGVGEAGDIALRGRPHHRAPSWRSTSRTKAGSSGSMVLAKLCTALPSREITYLWKFHFGAAPVRLRSSTYSGSTGAPADSATRVFVNIGNFTPKVFSQ